MIIGPALLALGVPAPAAAMFVFYYSVLSEVTPPTALAAVGASAITGGRTVPTMWQALKYALPAFLAPIAFVLTDPGEYLLGRGPGRSACVWATAGRLRWRWPRWPWPPAAGCSASARPALASRVLAAAGGLLLLYLGAGHHRWPASSHSLAGRAGGRGRLQPTRTARRRGRHENGQTCRRRGCSRWPRPRWPAAVAGRTPPATDAGGDVTCEVANDTRIGIATGNATGVYFALGNAYAEQISAATGGKVKATAAETGASVQNIQQLVAGSYEVAFSLADTAADAVQGTGSFDGRSSRCRRWPASTPTTPR